jgi:Ca-activated chloride channel family protein
VPLSGGQEEISAIDVRINQVEACPGPGVVTAYVSVTDQGGYPVIGLEGDLNNFTITENVGGDYDGPPTSVFYVSDTGATISVALVMDYSGSITDEQDNVDDMEESAADFIARLGEDDEAEIIKFADDFEVVQEWQFGTLVGKDLLEAAIYAPYNNGRETDLYDAVVQAVADAAASRPTQRKAVIVITDGENDAFLSNNDLADVINDANTKGVPIFAVGLGNVNLSILQQMADGTGGQVYKSTTSDNLRTIYQQLAELLFVDQYILTYTSGLGAVPAELKIEATLGALKGNENNTKQIAPCP